MTVVRDNSPRLRVGFDTETFLLGPGSVIPKIVCASWAQDGQGSVVGNGDADLHQRLVNLFSGTHEIVCHHSQFDLAVVCKAYPDLYPLVFQALEDGRVKDTEIREKLINLSLHGKLTAETLPDGSSGRIHYSLAELTKDYCGRDRSAEKTSEDAWRLNYHMLDGKRADEYPREAYDYAAQDAIDAVLVCDAQDRRIAETGASVVTEELHVFAAFCLFLITGEGMLIDPVKKAEVAAMLERELDPSKMPLLYSAGIVRPAVPPQPYKNGALNPDGTPKMKAGTEESVNKKALCAHVEMVCNANGIDIPKTPTGGTSTESAFLESIKDKSEVLEQYVHRQSLQKLVSTEMPRMDAPRVHFEYDVLKETGRTSSYASRLFPSANGQNIDPRVKPCYVSEPGWLICSIDYSTQELCTHAQKCYSLFGRSMMREVINRGIDTHAYMATVICYELVLEFREAIDEAGITDNWDAVAAFCALKKSEDPEARAFYKTQRKFAKPVNLGFPGGLGPATFVKYAAGDGVKVTLDQAIRLRDLQRQAYPEEVDFFDWIQTSCVDPRNFDPEGGDLYSYRSPKGMVRSGATFCAAANGSAMQTPSAEASKIALINIVRAAYDPSLGSCLYGTRPCNFVHDEVMVKIPDDKWAHERALELGRIMVEAMQEITPDVKVTANPCLMYRWSKDAEPTFDGRGRLVPWDRAA